MKHATYFRALALVAVVWAWIGACPAIADDEITFEPETVLVNRQGLEQRLQNIQSKLRDGDAAVMAYLERSVASVQQGHARGIEEFKVWYRNYERAREMANNSLIEAMVKSLFKGALNFVFPESGAFMDALKSSSQAAMDTSLTALRPVQGDINLFLDQVAASEGRVIQALQESPQAFRTRHADAVEAAKWEYVWNVEQTSLLPSSARNYLLSVGVPEEGMATSQRVKEEVLTAHIEAVLRANKNFMIGAGGPPRVYAQISALRHLGVEANKRRICSLERTLNAFYWSIPYGQCSGETTRVPR